MLTILELIYNIVRVYYLHYTSIVLYSTTLCYLYSICSKSLRFLLILYIFLVANLQNSNVFAGPDDLIQAANECFSSEWDLHKELERAASRTAADTEVDEAIARFRAKKLVSSSKMLIIVISDDSDYR